MRIVRVPDRKLGWWAICVGIGVVEREGIGTGVREREGGPRSLWLFSLFSREGGIEADGYAAKKDGRQRGQGDEETRRYVIKGTHSLMCRVSTTF